MTSARFRVVHAGPLITYQDGGRPGHRRFGVSPSGPMDRLSHMSANLAIGNSAESTAIEISMGGLVLECLSGSITLAIAGGAFQVECGDRKAESGVVMTLEAGETLAIRSGPAGSWCYLAFAGTVSAQKWLGHTSTHAASGFGGGILSAGDEFTVEKCRAEKDKVRQIELFSTAPVSGYFRVVLGPQEHQFSTDAKRLLLSSEFTLTTAYDRMGVRLDGPALKLNDALSIPSEPILRGSIQVSGEGVPTVLLADHQTTGGYPKIATLVSADFDDFAQLRPRDKIRFMAINPENAVKLARIHAIALRSYFKKIARA